MKNKDRHEMRLERAMRDHHTPTATYYKRWARADIKKARRCESRKGRHHLAKGKAQIARILRAKAELYRWWAFNSMLPDDF